MPDQMLPLSPMTFDPVAYINAPRWQQVSLGLERTRLLLDELGNPEQQLRFIHVAGTNGKGSTCAYLNAICQAAGLRTGLFTSPYIERFEERIRVNDSEIASEDLLRCTLAVKEAAEMVEAATGEHPTEFELMCTVALLHFAQQRCDICIMEVGLGGRLDSTNVITPEVSIITRIGFDHTDILGDTLDEITAEKAGIIKHGIPCVTCEQEPVVQEVIKDTCEEEQSPLTVVHAKDICSIGLNGYDIRGFAYRGEGFATRLLGSYQPENACLAIEGARTLRKRGWDIPPTAVKEGVLKAVWPGRLEVMSRTPLVIIDGAHNPDGAELLARTLEEFKPKKPPVYVIGVLQDKDVEGILKPHIQKGARYLTYAPRNPRALKAGYLAFRINVLDSEADVTAYATAEEAVQHALEEAAPESPIVAFGSLYSIADVKQALRSCLG